MLIGHAFIDDIDIILCLTRSGEKNKMKFLITKGFFS